MKLAIWYWLFLVLSALGGAWFHSGATAVPPYLIWANSVLLFILFVLIGFAVFGSPVAG